MSPEQTPSKSATAIFRWYARLFPKRTWPARKTLVNVVPSDTRPQRLIVRSPGSICSRPTYRSKPSRSGSAERARTSCTRPPKMTDVQPFFNGALLDIKGLLDDRSVQRFDQLVHLLPKLAPAGV